MFTFNIYQKPTALYADRLSKILDTNCNARIAKIAEMNNDFEKANELFKSIGIEYNRGEENE